ncbi:MAG: hypothetical protein A3F17_05595 [Gammaproteobacteria bacterium RIFCSPHIGHO2_12_FULL_41_15]|nr:MAG: hypothetical protein A3F17_05595 [Gammaproteobacteria bacterium RIFCSPHIGHO2_12_FULL_41_15]
MQRLIDKQLADWKQDKHRKPLIIRGARQVGKTSTVRHLAQSFKSYVEINLEEMHDLHIHFEGNLDPEIIIRNLGLSLHTKIIPGETLLFIDEAQALPRSLIALRYFYEKMPALHVIAAGSLLDFAIDQVGVPVGRVSFLYMHPMSLIEFLWAMDKKILADGILKQLPSEPFNAAIHNMAMKFVGEYMAVGGMPEAVATWRDTQDYKQCLKIHHDIISAYEQDFQKYAKETQIKHVEQIFRQMPLQLTKQFKYTNIPGNYRKRELQPALRLLEKACIIKPVYSAAANGLPLGGESNPEHFKTIMLDVALTEALLGQTNEEWILHPNESAINRGNITEAFVGQEILAYSTPLLRKDLYYWHKDSRSSQAEVDYVVNINHHIIPIEVKASKGSTLKSMHSFLESHPHAPYGIRISAHNYSVYKNIHSYPLYAVAALFADDF